MSGEFVARRIEQQADPKLPVLRVWTSDVPEEHTNMQKIAARAKEIRRLLGRHGVLEADISPPMRGDYYPDGTHFHISAKAPPLSEAASEEIYDFMSNMGFEGNIGTRRRFDGPEAMRRFRFTQMDTPALASPEAEGYTREGWKVGQHVMRTASRASGNKRARCT